MKRRGAQDSSDGSSSVKKGRKKSSKSNEVTPSKNDTNSDLKPLKGKRKRGSSNNGSDKQNKDDLTYDMDELLDSIFGTHKFANQRVNPNEKKRKLNDDVRASSESPSDLQPLTQYLKNRGCEQSSNTEIKPETSSPKKKEKGKRNVAEKPDAAIREKIDSKPGVLKNSKAHPKSETNKEKKLQENTSVTGKKNIKKVRIDESESIKYKNEIESEHTFSKKELPGKIIKSKKNLTEEGKVKKVIRTSSEKPDSFIGSVITNSKDSQAKEQSLKPNLSSLSKERCSRNTVIIQPREDTHLEKEKKGMKNISTWSPSTSCSTPQQSPCDITIKSEDSEDSFLEGIKNMEREVMERKELQPKRVPGGLRASRARINLLTYVDEDSSDESDLEVYYINKKAEREAELKLKQSQSESKRIGSLLMPKEDQLFLVERIQELIPEGDTKSYKSRIQNLEWAKVAFKNYSIDDCQKVWGQLFKKVRHYRLLSEVTNDLKQVIKRCDMQELQSKKSKKSKEKHPDMPKRPLSSYLLYYIRTRDKVRKEKPHLETVELNKYISEMYQNLPPDKKSKYDMLAAKNREEYKVKLEEFYALHPEFRKAKKEPKGRKEKPPKRPDNPYKLFMQSELDREEISEEDKSEFKEVCREKWRQMADAKKLEWINLAEERLVKYQEVLKEYMAKNPGYTPKNSSRKPFLTREEVKLKEKLAGKPKKPPTSAYSLFVSHAIQSRDAQEIPARERWAYTSAKWKAMTEAEKEKYKVLLAQITAKYKRDFCKYLGSLSIEKKHEEILKSIAKRKRKGSSKATAAAGSSARPSGSGLGQAVDDDRDQPSTSRGARPKAGSSKSSGLLKGAKAKQKVPYPVPPPRSAYKYFSEKYKGPNPKVAWKNLSCIERRNYNQELNVIKDKYIQDFESYLKSLDRDELSVFCANRNTQEEEYSSSDPSESESEDEVVVEKPKKPWDETTTEEEVGSDDD